MINSFWNLCRACPMPTEEKLNSEYKRNFTWHQNYRATKQDVIKKPPETSTPAAMEPAMPRKKKHPELAYRTNEVLKYEYEGGDSSDSAEIMPSNSVHFLHVKDDQDLRARSEERTHTKTHSGPRSRSADPNVGRNRSKPTATQSHPPPNPGANPNPAEVAEEAIVKTTEYRSQFAWPRPGSEAAAGTASGAKKSVSMGTIAAGKKDEAVLSGHQRDDLEVSSRAVLHAADTLAAHDAPMEAVDEVDKRGEMETTMDGQGSIFGDDFSQDMKKRKFKKTEYKAKYRPFSTYVYVDGNWKKPPKQVVAEKREVDPNSWYTEVLERLKKANEYRSRARGSPIYGDQPGDIAPAAELWMPVREPIVPAPPSVQRSPVKEDKFKDRSHTAPVHRPTVASAAHKREKVQEGKTERPSVRPSAGDLRKEKSEERKKLDAQSKGASEAAAPSRGEGKAVKPQARHIGTPPMSRPRAPPDEKHKREDRKQPLHPGPAGVHSRASSKASASPDSSSASSSKPRAVSRPSTTSAGAAVVNGEDGKIWLKPAAADEVSKGDEDEKSAPPPPEEPEEAEKEAAEVKESSRAESPAPPLVGSSGEGESAFEQQTVDDEVVLDEDKDIGREKAQEPSKSPVGNGEKKDVVRPNSLPPMNGVDLPDEKLSNKSYPSPSPLPEAHIGPVPLTNVKSPEEVTGVKSPDPETWTVPLDTGKGLEWTDGHTPSDSSRTKSSPLIPLLSSSKGGVAVNSEVSSSSPTDAGPAVSRVAEAARSTEVAPSLSSGRCAASDVLDRARCRLDQFWSKSK